jgi:hypothetical protein
VRCDVVRCWLVGWVAELRMVEVERCGRGGRMEMKVLIDEDFRTRYSIDCGHRYFEIALFLMEWIYFDCIM